MLRYCASARPSLSSFSSSFSSFSIRFSFHRKENSKRVSGNGSRAVGKGDGFRDVSKLSTFRIINSRSFSTRSSKVNWFPARVPAIGKSLFRCCFRVRKQSFFSIDPLDRAVEGTLARFLRKESKRNFANYLLFVSLRFLQAPSLMALINPRNVSSLDFSSSLPCSIPSSFSSPSFLPIPPSFDAATNCFKARDTDSTDRLRLISLVPPLLTHPVRSSCSCSRHFPLFRSPPALILLTRRRSAKLRGGKGGKKMAVTTTYRHGGRDYEQSPESNPLVPY